MSTEAINPLVNPEVQTKPEYRISIAANGLLAETVCKDRMYIFATRTGTGPITFESSLVVGGKLLAPASNMDEWFQKKRIRIATDVFPYETTKHLVKDIKQFIHRYADIPPFWKK